MNINLTLILTTRCNFNCIHCIRDHYTKHFDIPISVLKKSFKEADELGMKHIALTGGEPILYPKFKELVDLIKKYEFTWSFVSNGSFTKKYYNLLKINKEKLNFVGLSFDGGKKESHEYIRKESSWEKVIKAVKFYKSNKLYVRLLYTVNAKNINEIPEFIKLAQELKVDSLRFAGINPTGYTKELELNWEQKIGVYKYINEINKKIKMDISHTNSLYAETDADKFCPVINDHGATINPYGQYIFCCDTVSQGAVLGDLRKESFSQLYLKGIKKAAWIKKQRKKMIKEKKFFKNFNSCYFCNYLLKKEICNQKLFIHK